MNKNYGFSFLEAIISIFVIFVIIQIVGKITGGLDKETRITNSLYNIYSILGSNSRNENHKVPISEWGWDIENPKYAAETVLKNHVFPYISKVITCNNPLNCVGGYKTMNGEDYVNFRQDEDYARAVIGKNGYHIALKRVAKCEKGNTKSVCGILVIDINNKDAKNQLGDDVFVFAFYGDGGFRPYGINLPTEKINSGCTLASTGDTCAARIMKDNWKIRYTLPGN